MADTKKKTNYLSLLGPGLITGASDDDPSGIATYSQAGAAFGITTLWTVWFVFPMVSSIQEMCARIGLVTSHGLAGTLKRNYPRAIVIMMILFSFPAIVLNIGADIAGMGAVMNMMYPGVHAGIFSLVFTIFLMIMIIYLPYRKIANVLKWLCLTLLCYIFVPFLSHLDWTEIIKQTCIPTFHWNKDFMGIIVGILGTTISPYCFFWQASMEVEEVLQKKIIVDKKILSDMRFDIDFGMLFSNIVMYFIILSTGTILFSNGIRQIDTVDQAALALKPLAGNMTYLLFALGMLGTGFLAIPVLAGSLSYIISESFGWEEGLNKKFHEAKGFYLVIIISLVIALAINFIGISPVQSLIYTAILYGITAPVLIAMILHICNNKKIMGDFTNGKRSNILGGITFFVMTASALLLLFFELKS
ncbi:MAG TPA: divalent metal cation transporter [Bacteroidia bacterium]|nr:divalent metal cation transporter [Bacteroidia bacterium]